MAKKRINPRSTNYRQGYIDGFRRAEAMLRELLEVGMPEEKYEILISMGPVLSAHAKQIRRRTARR